MRKFLISTATKIASAPSTSTSSQETLPVAPTVEETASNSGDIVDANDPESNKSGSEDFDNVEENAQKKKKYQQKYRRAWEKEFQWLQSVNDNAYCKTCSKQLVNCKYLLSRHEKRECHLRNQERLKKTLTITQCYGNKVTKHTRLRGEIRLVMYCVKHHLPLTQMDFLPGLINSFLKDTTAVDRVKCGRKKGTSMINRILGPFALETISKDLINTKYSIIVDEDTDVSSKKCMVILVRYFDSTAKSVKDKFFGLFELDESTAELMYQKILETLEAFTIPFHNMIGFSSDNAAVMTGTVSGVSTRLKNKNPNILTVGCTCHNLSLCSNYAAKCLPEHIEKSLKDIYFYFCHITKKQKDFINFQRALEVDEHKILKVCQTRWLSLEMVVKRIIEQWKPLLNFFILHSFEDPNSKAVDILDFLKNKENLVFLNFIGPNLTMINNLNKSFQSETTKIHLLVDSMETVRLNIMKNFIKLENIDIKTDLRNPANYLPYSQMYFGLHFEAYILENAINETDIRELRKVMCTYYVELCIQIQERFGLLDEKIKILKYLDPKNVIAGTMPTVMGLTRFFPQNAVNIEDLNTEWRNLIGEYKIIENFTTDDIVPQWVLILNIKDGMGNFPYKNIASYMLQLCCLPHSSTAAERKFSQLKMIKNEKRNKLNTMTVHNTLAAKELLGTGEDFDPSDSLIRYASKFIFSDGCHKEQ